MLESPRDSSSDIKKLCSWDLASTETVDIVYGAFGLDIGKTVLSSGSNRGSDRQNGFFQLFEPVSPAANQAFPFHHLPDKVAGLVLDHLAIACGAVKHR